MNMLQTISNTNNDEQTMGTLEIAKMLEKQHAHIRTSAERLVQSGAINGGIALRDTPYINQQNQQVYYEYRLNKLDSITLVAQNCPQFTAALVKRWDELETKQKQGIQLPNFTDPIAACEAWMLQYKRSVELEVLYCVKHQRLSSMTVLLMLKSC